VGTSFLLLILKSFYNAFKAAYAILIKGVIIKHLNMTKINHKLVLAAYAILFKDVIIIHLNKTKINYKLVFDSDTL
jgi:hypothetical protein